MHEYDGLCINCGHPTHRILNQSNPEIHSCSQCGHLWNPLNEWSPMAVYVACLDRPGSIMGIGFIDRSGESLTTNVANAKRFTTKQDAATGIALIRKLIGAHPLWQCVGRIMTTTYPVR